MLNDLLRLLGDGGIHSTAELARRLGVNETLLAAMTGDLTRSGYLAAIDTSCATACDGCGIAATCARPRGADPARIPADAHAKGQSAAGALTA